MEFFDDSKNWNENEVKTGRSWQLPELRIKSNPDLHKIWFILLKELNMLKTMEHEYKKEWKWWASPERIDKVQESMKNVESVVRERNQAYHMLENGTSGERPGQYITNALGLREYKKSVEHVVPYWANKKWREQNPRGCHGMEYQKFIRLYREKLYNEKRKGRNRDKNHVIRLLSRFPNLDRTLLKEKYPLINFDTLSKKDLYRGHYVPKVE
jgi:large subunit ribosomal protein L47